MFIEDNQPDADKRLSGYKKAYESENLLGADDDDDLLQAPQKGVSKGAQPGASGEDPKQPSSGEKKGAGDQKLRDSIMQQNIK